MSTEAASKKSVLPQAVNVVGSLLEAVPPGGDWGRVSAACDVVEFRVDACPQAAAAVREAAAACPVPAILTVRDPREGGMNALGLTPRRVLLQSLVEDFRLVDIEIANLGLFRDVVQQARENGSWVIGSFHDFQGQPSPEVLADLIAEAQSLGADVVKFSVTPQSCADLAALGRLLEAPPSSPLSLMGMGPLGRVSRLLLGQLGSALNYGYLDDATVPGQWPAAELKRLLDELRA
ncbi:MAG: type I 3-dehydroquinate dehydratase [Verrucomicrobiales bacterium]